MQLTADIQKIKRHFVPEDFKVTTWETLNLILKIYWKEKLNRKKIWKNG